jgi:hypothetical protein
MGNRHTLLLLLPLFILLAMLLWLYHLLLTTTHSRGLSLWHRLLASPCNLLSLLLLLLLRCC